MRFRKDLNNYKNKYWLKLQKGKGVEKAHREDQPDQVQELFEKVYKLLEFLSIEDKVNQIYINESFLF